MGVKRRTSSRFRSITSVWRSKSRLPSGDSRPGSVCGSFETAAASGEVEENDPTLPTAWRSGPATATIGRSAATVGSPTMLVMVTGVREEGSSEVDTTPIRYSGREASPGK